MSRLVLPFVPKSKVELDSEYGAINDPKIIEESLMEAIFTEEGLKLYRQYEESKSSLNEVLLAAIND